MYFGPPAKWWSLHCPSCGKCWCCGRPLIEVPVQKRPCDATPPWQLWDARGTTATPQSQPWPSHPTPWQPTYTGSYFVLVDNDRRGDTGTT